MYRLVVLLHKKWNFISLFLFLYFSSLFLHRTSSVFRIFSERFLFGVAFLEGFLSQLTVVYTVLPSSCVFRVFCLVFLITLKTQFFFLEPGTAPRKVQVRPLSSSTMVIQWDEPETPNGQVTVSVFFSWKLFFFRIGTNSLTSTRCISRDTKCTTQRIRINRWRRGNIKWWITAS